jgi:hypothetical protein
LRHVDSVISVSKHPAKMAQILASCSSSFI